MSFDFLTRYIFTTIAAGLIAFVGTPLTLIVARRVGFIDSPGPRKLHLAPIPVLGGVAIWAAFVGSLIVFGQSREFRELVAIIVGGTLISLVGLVDDRFGLGPRGKLIGQVSAGVVLVLGGVQTHMFGAAWIDIPLTIVWVVGITNAINLMDNMDGLAAGVAAAASGSFLLLSMLNGQILVASLAAALLGACLGFLFYNFQPAVTFMGDTGSMLLGFALSVLGIKLTFPTVPIHQSWVVPILVLGLPIFDTALVLISRWRRGLPWWRGGTDHVSHRLARLGLSQRRVVVALYAVTAGLGLIAVIIVRVERAQVAWSVMVGLGLLAALLLYVMEQLLAVPESGLLKPDVKVTVIAGGAGLIPVLDAAMSLSRHVNVVLTPVAAGQRGLREIEPDRLRRAVLTMAYRPSALQRYLADAGSLGEGGLVERVAVANAAFRMRGQFLLLDSTLDRERVLAALQGIDLIVIGGELCENALPALLQPEISRRLRRSRRPRVLVHPDPRAALAQLKSFGLDDIITHAVAPQDMYGPWHAVPDLRDGRQIAQALREIWLQRSRARGLPQPLTGMLHG